MQNVGGNAMTSTMTRRITYIIICFLIFWTSKAIASPQMPDYLIYGNDTIATYNLILEQYLQQQDSTETEQLFGLTFREGASFNCWRGYQAIYKIENDSLFLVSIIGCGELRNGRIDKAQSNEKINSIFGGKFKNGKVYIDWFEGYINFPLNNEILRWDGVFYKIFEREKVLSISNGQIKKDEDFDNYIDGPKRIDRRDKSKISDLLFKKLKKAKWKNPNEFDCSEKYLVTINENGIVSNVRMVLSDEEINEYYEPDEFNFCIDKMMTALKDLQFDIIMDKGKPISEDIYIEIWVEDNGKIENWTY